MNNFDYAPETVVEEFAFMAGRVAALEAVLNVDGNTFMDKKYIAAILGIKYEEREGKNEML